MTPVGLDMEKDRFDHKMIDIEQKSFELGMLMSVFAYEILETFNNNTAEIEAIINLLNDDGASLQLETERISLNRETGVISVFFTGLDKPVMWDDLDLSSRNIIVNELHFRYKAEKLYSGLSDDGGVH